MSCSDVGRASWVADVADGLSRVLESLASAGGDRREALRRLCRISIDELGVSGAAVPLVIGGEHRGTLAVSDDWVVGVEDLQFTLGEGPCLDVHASGRPVLEADLTTSSRWPAYGPGAAALGVCAVFAIPLQVGAARFGAVDLYRRTPGPLAEGGMTALTTIAEVVTAIVIGNQVHDPTRTEDELLVDLSERRAVVHQAAGMISVQLDVSLEEALLALRARAFADGRGIVTVASEVVARTLRFDS